MHALNVKFLKTKVLAFFIRVIISFYFLKIENKQCIQTTPYLKMKYIFFLYLISII